MVKQTFPGFFSIQNPRCAGKGENIEKRNIVQNAHFLHKKEKKEKGRKRKRGTRKRGKKEKRKKEKRKKEKDSVS